MARDTSPDLGSGDPDLPGKRATGCRELRLGPAVLQLLPERAVWWEETSTLFVSDLHLGRAPGDDPEPEAAASSAVEDLARLGHLIERHGPDQVVVLGDLRHAPAPPAALEAANRVLREFCAKRRDPAMLLVRGNQDERTGDPPRAWGIETLDQGTVVRSLPAYHHPPEARTSEGSGPWIAGHLHPGTGVVPSGRRPGEVASPNPAFLLEGHGLVLPAFGSGARAHPPRRRARQRLLEIADGRVLAPRPRG